jgi:hypothetical protein
MMPQPDAAIIFAHVINKSRLEIIIMSSGDFYA